MSPSSSCSASRSFIWLVIFTPLMNNAHVLEGHMPQDPLAPAMPVSDARTLLHNSSASMFSRSYLSGSLSNLYACPFTHEYSMSMLLHHIACSLCIVDIMS
jgi:hypothetical protein